MKARVIAVVYNLPWPVAGQGADETGSACCNSWWRGDFELVDRDDDSITFDLSSRRLRGGYTLVHTTGKNWILFVRKVR